MTGYNISTLTATDRQGDCKISLHEPGVEPRVSGPATAHTILELGIFIFLSTRCNVSNTSAK